ncbi:helix-turn-helix transcriptional regulator [Kribbella kalugense]|uniref:AraC-like DNA-binding protein n=1 Tax=Kribbella kalugense TaxID=2512221 RepID=A0A4R7ZD88_9ACTN|nr:AraC family transcriptional regulator [Kribbella kalugense]TDW15182.1 AraC-like DNA-binding protein [Kribbella kalugense]
MSISRPSGLRAGFHAEGFETTSGLLHAGEQWVPEQFLIEPHEHPVWEIYLQQHGSTHWVADGQSYVLHPGHLFAVPPGVPHHLAGRSGNHHFYFAAIDLDPVVRRQPALATPWPKTVVHREAGELTHAFAQLVRELATRYEYAETGLTLAVDQLVLAVSRSLAPAAVPQLAMHPAVRTVKRLLDQEFHEGWTLRQLADRVGLAPAYLAELFVGELGQPPHRYLNERRIDRARQLLETSDVTITALAFTLGFSSSQHFARVFRQLTDTTPTAFRSSQSR